MERHEADFRHYAESFLIGEADFDRAICNKIKHSFRVLAEARKIADAESFPSRLKQLAEMAALYHDYGRFEQFSRYRTFSDPASVDHGRLSAMLCREHYKLAEFSPTERGMILAAIRVHNALKMPDNLTGEARLLTGVTRDADKLDILSNIPSDLTLPENKSVIWGLDPYQEISPKVAEALEGGRTPTYDDFRSVADFVVTKFLWYRDMNFEYSKFEFKRRNFFDRLCNAIPGHKQAGYLRELGEKLLV